MNKMIEIKKLTAEEFICFISDQLKCLAGSVDSRPLSDIKKIHGALSDAVEKEKEKNERLYIPYDVVSCLDKLETLSRHFETAARLIGKPYGDSPAYFKAEKPA